MSNIDANMNEILKEIYGDALRSQLEKQSALLRIIEANKTPAEKARDKAAAERRKLECHSSIYIGDDESYYCDLLKDHVNPHTYVGNNGEEEYTVIWGYNV